MLVLGLCDGHDAGACLLADGHVLAAVSEERLSRRKRAAGFPYRAIGACLELGGVSAAEVEAVAAAEIAGRAVHRTFDALYRRLDPNQSMDRRTNRWSMAWQNFFARSAALSRAEARFSHRVLTARLRALGFRAPLTLIDHHRAHAEAAARGSGLAEALVVTQDAFGDGLSGSVWTWKNGALNQLLAVPFPHSPALVYGLATAWLGFVEGEEGQVAALAATGDPTPAQTRFAALFARDQGRLRLRAIPPPRWFERELGGLSASQVGAGLQAAVGEAVAGLARDWLQRAGMRSLCLAGGLFANVRLNQAVGEAGGCEDLYVFPHMGDGGLCIGAAWAQQGAPAPHEPLNPYLGPSLISPRESPPDQVGIARQPLTPTAVEALAAALQEGEAVAISRGRLEFGPRALGNRSLLFSARRPELAEKWNRALARPSVMPFAPAVRAEDFARVAEGAPWRCFAHMTCTANAKPGIRARYPLAVHADGSMRVQTVTRSAQPLLYDFLTAYAKHEDPPLVINTSFNLHGEPIVADSRRAWRLFLQLPLAALVTDDACVWKSA